MHDAYVVALAASSFALVGGLPPEQWAQQAADLVTKADQIQGAQDWQGALDLYYKALDISPNPPPFQKYVLHNNIGWSLYHLGRSAEAEDHYQAALKASPNEKPPTDHAFINLATLYKAQGRTKATIKAYQAAVDLTKQMPTWANLGWELIHDCRVEEAVTTLSEAISAKGDAAPAAQQVYAYLGVAQSQRRRWALASQAFVKSIDIGLPADADGCKGGRWKVAEGWSDAEHVTVHMLPVQSVVQALRTVAAPAPLRPPKSGDATLADLATAPFTDAFTGETYEDAESPGGGYRVIELRGAMMEGEILTSLYHPAPDCTYYMGEQSASGWPHTTFGHVEREKNHSHDKKVPFPVVTKATTAPVFGVVDVRAALHEPLGMAADVCTKMLLLLKAVIEPEWDALRGAYEQVGKRHGAKLFVTEPLKPFLRILRRANLVRGKDGQPHPLLDEVNWIVHEWMPGLRYSFKRLILIDVVPPTPRSANEDAAAGYRNLKLALHRTRQTWRIYSSSLHRLRYPRRASMLLHRAMIRSAAGIADGTATVEAPPRILLYSRVDMDRLVIKGEKSLFEALQSRFGKALAVFRVGTQHLRVIDAAKTFGTATAVVGPHGGGLVGIMYCEIGTPLFLMTTYDTASPEHDGPDNKLRKTETAKLVSEAQSSPGGETYSPADTVYSYLAAAVGVTVHVLPHAKAHVVFGNYSLPPYKAKKVVEHVHASLVKMGRWKARPGEQMATVDGEDAGAHDAAAAGGKWSSLTSFLLPLWSPPMPVQNPSPPPRLPPPKPPPPASASAQPPPLPPQVIEGGKERDDRGLPTAAPSGPPPVSSTNHATPHQRAFPGLSALEQPFGRGFRLKLPETLSTPTATADAGGETGDLYVPTLGASLGASLRPNMKPPPAMSPSKPPPQPVPPPPPPTPLPVDVSVVPPPPSPASLPSHVVVDAAGSIVTSDVHAPTTDTSGDDEDVASFLEELDAASGEESPHGAMIRSMSETWLDEMKEMVDLNKKPPEIAQHLVKALQDVYAVLSDDERDSLKADIAAKLDVARE